MKNLQQEFGIVSFETASIAREKGFLDHCDWQYAEYDNNKLINWKDERVKECIEYDIIYAYKAVERLAENYNHKLTIRDDGYYLAAPQLHILQKWLRKKHKLHIEIIGFVSEDLETISYSFWIRNLRKYSDVIVNNENFNNYEEALEKGLQAGLKLIKDEL
jgi:hypothetical protein